MPQGAIMQRIVFLSLLILLTSCSWFRSEPELPKVVQEIPAKPEANAQPEAPTPVASEPIALPVAAAPQPEVIADIPGHEEPKEEAPAPAPAAHHEKHWSYSGETGPDHWGKLDESSKLCSQGKAQSPVNLKWSAPVKGGDMHFSYESSKLKIIDNGHTLQVNFEPGSKINIRGQDYSLLQMHFHTNSEHQLSGKSFPMELHFVHKNDQGQLAVLGVFLQVGRPNTHVEKLWKNWPFVKNQEVEIKEESINPIVLLPKQLTYYHYSGSLTTPPCSEGVNWNVLNNPIEISQEQLDAFRTRYPVNARPVQALNKRKVTNF